MHAIPPAMHHTAVTCVTSDVNAASRFATMSAAFAERYGALPTHWSRAPGRIDLMGSHTDYNQGWVLTMNIDRDTWVAGRTTPGDSSAHLEVKSLNAPGSYSFDLKRLERFVTPTWPNYVGGMAWVLAEAGCPLQPAQVLVHSTAPLGIGLGSSAALEMATSALMEAMCSVKLDAPRRAVLGQRAENHFVGVDCGITDQYSVSAGRAGHILMVDSRSLHSFNLKLAQGLQVMVCNTNAPRRPVDSLTSVRRSQCQEVVQALRGKVPGIRSLRDLQRATFEALAPDLSPELAKRARFVIEESGRVVCMAEALEMGDRKAIRKLMSASYRGAGHLYNITVPEMDAMVHAANHAPGIIGVRQTGAGFGGSMVAVIEKEEVDAFIKSTGEHYLMETGIVADIFPVEPVQGAGMFES